MEQYLILRLEAPIMSFGGVAVDNRGVEMAFPPVSMITGLLGNALGYKRQEFDLLQRLQDRIRMAIRIDREGSILNDFQTVQLAANDQGWTTRGTPEGRAGGAKTYDNKHLRYRNYHADRVVSIALYLVPQAEAPDVAALLAALNEPARPLFIGRKSCLPSAPIGFSVQSAESARLAFAGCPLEAGETARFFEPIAHDVVAQPTEHRISGLRIWANQVHGGEQRWLETRIDNIEESP